MKRITLQDVGEAAGVDFSTVSRVLNNKHKEARISEDTRERVLEAAHKLGYFPNNLARGLKNRRTQTLGLVISDNLSAVYAQITFAAVEAARRAGYSVMIGNTAGSEENEERVLGVLVERCVDGILFAPSHQGTKALKAVTRWEVPVVLVDRQVEGPSRDFVGTDNRRGGFLASKYLLDRGHSLIAHLAGPQDVPTARDKLLGYQDALLSVGREAEGEFVRVVHFGREEAVEGFVAGMLKGPTPPTGFFCVNPRTTVYCLRALHKAGVRVPSEAEVVGYDDLELPVPVPTVRQPTYRIGENAVTMLLDRIEGRRTEPLKVYLDPEVVLPEEG